MEPLRGRAHTGRELRHTPSNRSVLCERAAPERLALQQLLSGSLRAAPTLLQMAHRRPLPPATRESRPAPGYAHATVLPTGKRLKCPDHSVLPTHTGRRRLGLDGRFVPPHTGKAASHGGWTCGGWGGPPRREGGRRVGLSCRRRSASRERRCFSARQTARASASHRSRLSMRLLIFLRTAGAHKCLSPLAPFSKFRCAFRLARSCVCIWLASWPARH